MPRLVGGSGLCIPQILRAELICGYTGKGWEIMSRKVINIINFVRGVEPRLDMDLYTPVQEEIKLVKKYGFENTFLIQYDALIMEEFQKLFIAEQDRKMELGVWLEIVKPLCEKIGIPWNSELGYDWDWHVKPGLLQAYTQGERKLLIDEVMHMFQAVYGELPKSVGSWLIDSFSMQYMSERYGIDAFAICRDQWGTDGYTLWGGYYNQGYYPCKNNMLIPAQSASEQIDTPVFRMLGSDPIYQYDAGFENSYNMVDLQPVRTLEPVWRCGSDVDWVKWYFRNNFENEDLGFSYTQVGQENSFGWQRIRDGLSMQLEIINEMVKEDKVIVEKLRDTGKWFKENFLCTPATSITFLDDCEKLNNQSIWYNSKNYRANLFSNGKKVWFRDIHKFDEKYMDRYLFERCTEDDAIYDSLPIVDGYRWSKDEIRAGLYFNAAHKIGKVWRKSEDLYVELIVDDNNITVCFNENEIAIRADNAFELFFEFSDDREIPIVRMSENNISYKYMGFEYSMFISKGIFENFKIKSVKNELILV